MDNFEVDESFGLCGVCDHFGTEKCRRCKHRRKKYEPTQEEIFSIYPQRKTKFGAFLGVI